MKYLKLMRIKHYPKNGLVLLPLIFSGELLHKQSLFHAILACICFCLTASIVYIINDLKDIDKDRNHPVKKNRPLASGKVKPIEAIILIFVIIAAILGILLLSGMLLNPGNIVLLLYLGLNILYSFGLKDIPLLDVTILAFGFVLRVIYGGIMLDIEISNWLFLTVLSVSYYMALGKRRNEIKKISSGNTRKVLKYYTKEFLDKNMYMFLSLAVVFYSLWATIGVDNSYFKYSVVFVILILMKYSMDVEQDSFGDPIDVILNDKVLIGVTGLYGIFCFLALYVF